MRLVLSIVLVLAFVSAGGCARRKAGRATVRPAPARPQRVIISPENLLVGKVARVNAAARFVVLNYPIGHVPPVGQRLNLYRRGLKVAEVRVSSPQLEDNTVADILTGDAEVGDEAREK